MKKIFVLVLVLAMVSGASAAVVGVQVNGGSSVITYPGQSFTVDIVTVSGFSGAMGNWMGQIDMDIVADNDDIDVPDDGELHPMLSVGLGWTNGILAIYPDVITGIKGRAAISSGIQDGQTIYSFELKVVEWADYGVITIDLANLIVKNPFNTPIATTVNELVVILFPEPMTIALLGLGGLFLRRRK